MNTRYLEAANARARFMRQAHALSQSGPIVNILDPRFQYVPSNATDIRETFKRARERGPLIPQPKKVQP